MATFSPEQRVLMEQEMKEIFGKFFPQFTTQQATTENTNVLAIKHENSDCEMAESETNVDDALNNNVSYNGIEAMEKLIIMIWPTLNEHRLLAVHQRVNNRMTHRWNQTI